MEIIKQTKNPLLIVLGIILYLILPSIIVVPILLTGILMMKSKQTEKLSTPRTYLRYGTLTIFLIIVLSLVIIIRINPLIMLKYGIPIGIILLNTSKITTTTLLFWNLALSIIGTATSAFSSQILFFTGAQYYNDNLLVITFLFISLASLLICPVCLIETILGAIKVIFKKTNRRNYYFYSTMIKVLTAIITLPLIQLLVLQMMGTPLL